MIATLGGSIPLAQGDNKVDLAWCRPIPDTLSKISLDEPLISGTDDFVARFIQQGRPFKVLVRSDGAKIRGTIHGIQGTKLVASPADYPSRSYRFIDVIELQLPDIAGFSGSLVISEDNRVGALLFAHISNSDIGFAIPWSNVETEFERATGSKLLYGDPVP